MLGGAIAMLLFLVLPVLIAKTLILWFPETSAAIVKWMGWLLSW